MTKNEIKLVAKQWFLSKGFTKGVDKAFGNHFRVPLAEFDVYVMLHKDRFDEVFNFDIGFQLKNNSSGWGHIRVIIPNEKYWKHITMADGSKAVVKHNFYYEEWSKEDYTECLEKIYEIYIKPYFDLGFELLKIIAKDPTCGGKYGASKEHPYGVHPEAVKVILSK